MERGRSLWFTLLGWLAAALAVNLPDPQEDPERPLLGGDIDPHG